MICNRLHHITKSMYPPGYWMKQLAGYWTAPHPAEKPSIFSCFGDWSLHIVALLITPFVNMQTPSSVRHRSSRTKIFEYKIERFFHDHFQLKPLSTNPDRLLVIELCVPSNSINRLALKGVAMMIYPTEIFLNTITVYSPTLPAEAASITSGVIWTPCNWLNKFYSC